MSKEAGMEALMMVQVPAGHLQAILDAVGAAGGVVVDIDPPPRVPEWYAHVFVVWTGHGAEAEAAGAFRRDLERVTHYLQDAVFDGAWEVLTEVSTPPLLEAWAPDAAAYETWRRRKEETL
jgi:hypothetical protein